MRNATNTQISAPRRQGHKKGSRTLTKLALWLLLLTCVFIALQGPIETVTQAKRKIAAPAGIIDSHEFMAILYKREQTENAEVDMELLGEQIQTLKTAGFQPIGISDVLQLLQQDKPLPRKAVLLAVDGEDYELLTAIDELTKKERWGGLIVTSTLALENDTTETSWQDLQSLQKSGRWEIGTTGHRGNNVIATDPAGNTQMHLIARQWLPRENRKETDEEFSKRVLLDHQNATAISRAKLNQKPVVYIFPDGNAGQFSAQGNDLAQWNRMAAGSLYDLAFITGQLARNTQYTPPHHLNMLRVKPNWTGQVLLDALQRASIRIASVEEATMATTASGWVQDRGLAKLDTAGLVIQPQGNARDARIWLAGSNQLRDFHASFLITAMQSGIRIYLRENQDTSGSLQLAIADDGRVTLEHWTKNPTNITRKILAEAFAVLLDKSKHKIDIFVRSGTLDAEIDGKSLFDNAISLPFQPSKGLVGISTYTDGKQQNASITLTEARFRRPPNVLASWDFGKQNQDFVIHQVHKRGTQLTNISPPLMPPGTFYAQENEVELFRKLANVYSLQVTPKLAIQTEQDLQTWTPGTIMRALEEQQSDGLYVSFAENTAITIPQLDVWLRQTNRALSGAGRSLLVRLPRALERLSAINAILAVIPSITVVTDSSGLREQRITGITNRSMEEREIPPPNSETQQDLPQLFTINDDPLESSGGMEEQISVISAEAERAFSQGAYESAIAHFSTWHELQPSSPTPLKRIGDALVNLGYRDEAIGFYRQTLELDPAQISLATQLARILTENGSRAESRALLNIYARLFPQNTSILLAQATWLLRDNRQAEAIERIKHVTELEPNNFDAVLLELQLAQNDEERMQTIQKLIKLSSDDTGRRRLIRAIRQHDLLTLQHSYLLVGFLQENLENVEDQEMQDMIEKLEPLTAPIREDFATSSGLSEYWLLEGLNGELSDEILTLQVSPTRSQADARLQRAERWRDSFIEVDLASARGGFWIYARKSNRQLVRMGFEDSQNRIYIQVWGGPRYDVLQNRFVPWEMPEEGVTLRLEVSGHGTMGYIDGQPMLDSPLELPADFGFGWTAFSMDAQGRGDAKIGIRSIASGPIPFCAAIVPLAPPVEEENDQLDRMHAVLPHISDLAPDWYQVNAENQWEANVHPEADFYRIFASYHRLRLTPLVRVARGANIRPEDIITLARTHGYNGFTLLFNSMPDNAWFSMMDQALNVPGIDLIAVEQTAPGFPAKVRGIAGSSTLFPHAHKASPINMLSCQNMEAVSNAVPQLQEYNPAILTF